MVNNTPELLLSICIPTRLREEVLLKTLDSIFNSNANPLEYEVVIYDSSNNENLKNIITEYYEYSNLVYKQGENCGFLNLIEALKMGRGHFLKLHNDYSELLSGSLLELLDMIRFNLTTKPVLFFLNNNLNNKQIKKCVTFDDFLYNISYNSSWSTAFGIWQADFYQIQNININKMFPHTSLLFATNNKEAYFIINDKLFNNKEISKKGGYNLFETFAVTYLKMVEDCLKDEKISECTFQHIKNDMFKNFFIPWYRDTKILKNQYTFILTNVESSIRVYYSAFAYYCLIIFAYVSVVLKFAKNIVKK